MSTYKLSPEVQRGYRRWSDDVMQVRVHKADGSRSMFYYPGVSANRAAQLAAETCAAQCIADVDYLEVIDDSYDYDSPGILIADWQGNPAITINAEVR